MNFTVWYDVNVTLWKLDLREYPNFFCNHVRCWNEVSTNGNKSGSSVLVGYVVYTSMRTKYYQNIRLYNHCIHKRGWWSGFSSIRRRVNIMWIYRAICYYCYMLRFSLTWWIADASMYHFLLYFLFYPFSLSRLRLFLAKKLRYY